MESVLGVGTTFCIYLPASPEKALARKSGAEEKLIAGAGRILVMDDDEYIRDITNEMLNNIGYEVTTAIDGAEAIKLYQEAEESGRPYRAVIADLTIPGGMGGREVIRRLREIDPRVRAIVSSGYSIDPVMIDFRDYGFRGAISKPYTATGLSVALYEVLSE